MKGCTNRTDLGARGISTVIAQFGNKETFHYLFIPHPILFKTMRPSFRRIDIDIFVLIDFISFYPCAEIAVRDLVFYTAGPDAGTATYASGCVHDKGPVEVFKNLRNVLYRLVFKISPSEYGTYTNAGSTI